jgi:hypothetical protein
MLCMGGVMEAPHRMSYDIFQIFNSLAIWQHHLTERSMKPQSFEFRGPSRIVNIPSTHPFLPLFPESFKVHYP